jgi:O-antigen/teichoic acid export membrane protein
VYFRYYRPLDHSVSVEPDLKRRIVEYAVPVTASEAAGNLSGRIDTILVGFFLNPIAVSYYTIAKQVVAMIQSPVNALGFTLAPTFGAEKSAGNIDTAARIYEESFIHIMLLYLPASVGIILIAEPLVGLVFGRDYLGAVPVLQVFGLYAIIQANLLVSDKGLDFLGRARTRAIIKSVTSAMNFGLNIVLIPRIGVVGAAIATVATSSLYAISNIYIIHQELQLKTMHLLKETGKIAVITSIMAIVVLLCRAFIDGWITLLAVVATGVLIWAVLSIKLNLVNIRSIIADIT